MADRLDPSIPQEVSHQRVTDIAANVASLNEIVSALVSAVATGETVDESWANLVFETLREQNWRLGFAFNEERPPASWYELEHVRKIQDWRG